MSSGSQRPAEPAVVVSRRPGAQVAYPVAFVPTGWAAFSRVRCRWANRARSMSDPWTRRKPGWSHRPIPVPCIPSRAICSSCAKETLSRRPSTCGRSVCRVRRPWWPKTSSFRDLGQADFSVSRTGILAYQSGGTASRLVWFRRDGTDAGQLGEPADYFFLNLSSDGQKVAVDVLDRRGGTTDLRVFDLARGGQSAAVTSDQTVDWAPVLSPDGDQVAFVSARRGAPHVHASGSRTQGEATSWWALLRARTDS